MTSTLTRTTPMRRCGKRWDTLEGAEAAAQRVAQSEHRPGTFFGEECRDRRCGGFHVRYRKEAKPSTPRKAPKDTGPSAAVRAAVLERDQYACLACGKPVGIPGTWWSIQHRKARGQGGTNDLANLITLCGSATSDGCHLRCERRQRVMQAQGYWLESWQDPAAEPVMIHSEHGSGVMVWLTPAGGYSTSAPEGAA